MKTLFNKKYLPPYMFDIEELNLSDELLVNPLKEDWFVLGFITLIADSSIGKCESLIERQSVLIKQPYFKKIFGSLKSIGNTFSDLGEPKEMIFYNNAKKIYMYNPFYSFDLDNSGNLKCEPLVFFSHYGYKRKFFINPDILIFFELEEKIENSWWDNRLSTEVIRYKDEENYKSFEIKKKYLLKYLKARQMALLVGHYRDAVLQNPTTVDIEKFQKQRDDVVIGSSRQGAKALIQNWELENGNGKFYLRRRLHLWFRINPPKIDIADQFLSDPDFDPHVFTFNTRSGNAAPARWKSFKGKKFNKFAGLSCEFLEPIYFRQEVLKKYENSDGTKVLDNGSVICSPYWSLQRSVKRHGNELVSTYIGDFAEGVPFEEWHYWKQFAVDAPSVDNLQKINQETPIPELINSILSSFERINNIFGQSLWEGGDNSIAAKQLKFVYPNNANEEEFLTRVTFLSTFIVEELSEATLRKLVLSYGKELDRNFKDKDKKKLGSRNLFQRILLIRKINNNVQPYGKEMRNFIEVAEGTQTSGLCPDLIRELKQYNNEVHDIFSPLAYIYDIRNNCGVAHSPNTKNLKKILNKFGFPYNGLNRSNFIFLLKKIIGTLKQITDICNVQQL